MGADGRRAKPQEREERPPLLLTWEA